MRPQFILAKAVAAIMLVLAPLCAQIPSLDLELGRRYRMTGFDGTGFDAGSVLIVLKDGLVGSPATRPRDPTTVYKDGELHSSRVHDLTEDSQSVQAFAKGAKVFVHQIDVSTLESSIRFYLVSGYDYRTAVPRNYYKATVRFEFPKGYLNKPNIREVEDVIETLLKVDFSASEGEAPAGARPLPKSLDLRPVLKNDDVLELVQAKISDAVVIKKMDSSRCDFDTSPHELARLKQAGVSDDLLKAMLDAASRIFPASRQPAATWNVGVQGSVEEYSALLDKSPNSTLLYEQRARAYLSLGQVGKAISDYSRAIEIDPKKWTDYLLRGGLFLRIGDYRSAYDDYTRIIDLAPNPSVGYQMRAMTLGKENDVHGELADLDRAIQADPQNEAPYRMKQRLLEGSDVTMRWRGDQLGEVPPPDAEPQSPAPAKKPAGPLPPQIYRIEAGIVPPVGTATPAAPYPPKARNNGVHGTVKFEIVVDANGSVVDAREISAELGDGLDASALDTVRTWKFKPATKNAVPIAVRMVVEFAFGPS